MNCEVVIHIFIVLFALSSIMLVIIGFILSDILTFIRTYFINPDIIEDIRLNIESVDTRIEGISDDVDCIYDKVNSISKKFNNKK